MVSEVVEGLGGEQRDRIKALRQAGEFFWIDVSLGTASRRDLSESLGIPALWIPAANSDNQQHDVNEHYVLRHFYQQIGLYADIVGSRPV